MASSISVILIPVWAARKRDDCNSRSNRLLAAPMISEMRLRLCSALSCLLRSCPDLVFVNVLPQPQIANSIVKQKFEKNRPKVNQQVKAIISNCDSFAREHRIYFLQKIYYLLLLFSLCSDVGSGRFLVQAMKRV